MIWSKCWKQIGEYKSMNVHTSLNWARPLKTHSHSWIHFSPPTMHEENNSPSTSFSPFINLISKPKEETEQSKRIRGIVLKRRDLWGRDIKCHDLDYKLTCALPYLVLSWICARAHKLRKKLYLSLCILARLLASGQHPCSAYAFLINWGCLPLIL